MAPRLLSRFTKDANLTFEEKSKLAFSILSRPLISSWGATSSQLDELYEAYVSLWSSTPDEHRAREIYTSLISIAKMTNERHPIDWLFAEMLFEAFVASTGDREWAAQMELKNESGLSEEKALRRYNQRLARVL